MGEVTRSRLRAVQRAINELQWAERPLSGRALVSAIKNRNRRISDITARKTIQRALNIGKILRTRLRFQSGHIYFLPTQRHLVQDRVGHEIVQSESGLKRIWNTLALPRCLSLWDAAKISGYPVKLGTGSHGQTLQKIISDAEADGIVQVTANAGSSYLSTQSASHPRDGRTIALHGHLLTLPGQPGSHLASQYPQQANVKMEMLNNATRWLVEHKLSKGKFQTFKEVGGMVFDAVGAGNTQKVSLPIVVEISTEQSVSKAEVLGLQERVLVAFMKHRDYGRRKEARKKGVQAYFFAADFAPEAKAQADKESMRINLVPYLRLSKLRAHRTSVGVRINEMTPTEFRNSLRPRFPAP